MLVNTTDIKKLNKAQVLFKFNFVDCEAAETELSYIHNRKLCICWQSIAVIHNFRFPVAATGLFIFFFFFLFSADDCISWGKKKEKKDISASILLPVLRMRTVFVQPQSSNDRSSLSTIVYVYISCMMTVSYLLFIQGENVAGIRWKVIHMRGGGYTVDIWSWFFFPVCPARTIHLYYYGESGPTAWSVSWAFEIWIYQDIFFFFFSNNQRTP